MNTKKLIGTIIGVALFAALIAGATYAFLTFNAVVEESASMYLHPRNFSVDYTAGDTVTTLPQLASGGTLANPTASSPLSVTPSQTSSLVVILKNKGTDGHASIKLTTTSTGALTEDGLVNWVICRDPDVESGTQVDDVCGKSFANATNHGVVRTNSTITLLSDAALAQGSSDMSIESTEVPDYLLEEDGVSYFVYFWLNSTLMNSEHVVTNNNQYSGYIHASAAQLKD